MKTSTNRERTVVKGLRRSRLPLPCSQECYLLGFYSLRLGVIVLFRGRFWRQPPSAICVNFKSRTLGSRCEFLQRRTRLLAVYRNGDWGKNPPSFCPVALPRSVGTVGQSFTCRWLGRLFSIPYHPTVGRCGEGEYVKRVLCTGDTRLRKAVFSRRKGSFRPSPSRQCVFQGSDGHHSFSWFNLTY